MGDTALDADGNGRATIREVHGLLREIHADLNLRIDAVQAGIGDQLSKLIETVQTMATTQAHTNGALEARVTALENARTQEVGSRTVNRSAVIGALVLGAVDAAVAAAAFLHGIGR